MTDLGVHFYQDGKNLIVVFENAPSDIYEIINKMMIGLTSSDANINQVPVLKVLPVVQVEPPKDFSKYDELMPDFLSDEDYGSDMFCETQTDPEPRIVVVANEPLESLIDVSNELVFQTGQYRGLSPSDVVKWNKERGFADMCRLLITNECPVNLLVDVKAAVKQYYTSAKADFERVNAWKRGELEHFLLTYSDLCEDVISRELIKRTYPDIMTFIMFERDTNLRTLCELCIECVDSYISNID